LIETNSFAARMDEPAPARRRGQIRFDCRLNTNVWSVARLRRRMAGLGEMVGAGLPGDFVEALADAVPVGRRDSLGSPSQVRFQLGESPPRRRRSVG
jgi:hypothetical protein